MTNLDDVKQMKSLDKSNMVASIEQLGEQIQQTWDEVEKLEIPKEYGQISKIVFSGMGGSALGAYVAKNLYTTKMKQSFEIVNDYHLPGYVDEQTLVVAGSYSGTTEETVSGLTEAQEKKAKVIVIATGGKLEAIAEETGVPYYKMQPKFNPCNQPRMGIGYSVFALLRILQRLEVIHIDEVEIGEIKTILKNNNERYGATIPEEQNSAKQIAQKVFGKIPVFVAGQFLIGAIHAVRNQLHENAKSQAVYYPLPELDHHLLEALQFPQNIQANDHYIFFHSNLYSERINKRSLITREVVEANGHSTSVFEPQASGELAQTIESINFGSYVGYYLALLNGIDPSPIKWVEEFKKKLA